VLVLLHFSSSLCGTVAFSHLSRPLLIPSQPLLPSSKTLGLRTSSNTQYQKYRIHQQGISSRNDNQQSPTTSFSLHALPVAAAAVSTSAKATAAATVGTTLKQSFSSILSSFHGDTFYVLSSMLLLSSFGIILEKRTTIGKALSAPLATMAMALTIANLGLIPFTSTIYTFTNRILIPLAIPLLLFDSDLRRVITDTGTLLVAFIIGSLSTVISTILTYMILPLSFLGENGWKIGSALAARHIGGAINFVSVCETLNVDNGSIVSAAIAADNVVVALYFALLFYLAVPGEEGDSDKMLSETDVGDDMVSGDESALVTKDGDINKREEITMQSLAVSLTVASCLVMLGKIITKAALPVGASALPLISIITVIAATIFSQFFQSLRVTGTALGIVFMQMFFAASGAAGSIRLVIESAPSLFLFSALQIALHFCSLMSIGKLIFKLKAKELYLASNANVGGPTTAAAMATAKEWKRLTLPALLVGILGYATATPIALALGQIILRLPSI